MCRDECFTNHCERLLYSNTLTHSLIHSIVSIKMGKSIFERDIAVVAEAEAEPNRWLNDWMVTVSKIMLPLLLIFSHESNWQAEKESWNINGNIIIKLNVIFGSRIHSHTYKTKKREKIYRSINRNWWFFLDKSDWESGKLNHPVQKSFSRRQFVYWMKSNEYFLKMTNWPPNAIHSEISFEGRKFRTLVTFDAAHRSLNGTSTKTLIF